MYIVYFTKNSKQMFVKKYEAFEQALTQLEQLQKNHFKTFCGFAFGFCLIRMFKFNTMLKGKN